ncbi:MAG TPA: S-layer homology domain-containing protein [Chloroflexia bacterium]
MQRRLNLTRRDLLVTLALLVALGVTAGLIRLQIESQQKQTYKQSQAAARSDLENTLYAAEPGEGNESGEIAKRDAYWNARYTYPTGKADPRWLLEAARQDKARVKAGVPGGQATYRQGDSPLALITDRWLSIGPQPQDSDTCEVCFSFGIVAGRVNDIVIDPITPTIAYFASDGGGVWKTTNCCSPATTWEPTTDSPLVTTSAIGDLALDPTNHYVYAGTGDLRFGSFSFGSAGLLKSVDLGATWQIKGADVFGMAYEQPPGVFPQYDSIGKVAVNPLNSNQLAVGTKRGMWFSYDQGDNWAGPCLPDPFPTQRQDITAIIAMTNTSNLTDLFVAVGARGYSTTVQVNLGDNGANGIYKATWPTTGCPSNWSLVSRSNNGWPNESGSGNRIVSNSLNEYVSGNPLGRIDLAFAPSNPDYIYAEVQAIATGAVTGTVQRGGLLGIWRSTDRGDTWELRTTAQDLEDAQDACGGACVGDLLNVCGDVAQNWYDQHIAVDPNDPEVIFFDNINIWKSEDGGETVRDLTCGYSTINVPRPVHVDQHAITFYPGSSSRALFGNDGGVYYTANANTVQPAIVQLNSSLSTIEFYGGDISANFATSVQPFAVAGAQDNGSSSWTAADPSVGPYLWQQRIGGDGMYARIEPVLGQRVYMEAQNGAMRLSETGHPGPYPLMNVETNFTVDTPRLSFVFPYEIYKGEPGGLDDCPPTGCVHMIGGTYRVWENDGGARIGSPWVPTSQDLTKNTLADRSFINQLAYAPRTKKLAIAGTNDGNVAIGFNLHMRPVTTATWVNVTGGNSVLPNRPVLDVALDPNIAMTTTMPVGYAAVGGFDQNTPSTPGHVFQVTCTAANCASFTWANKSGNLPNIPVNGITANPNFPQQVFAGTDWGVYYTNDITVASPVWLKFSNGMPSVMVWDFAIDRGFTTLAAFTRSRGVFVWPLPDEPFVLTPTPTGTGTPPTAAPTSIPVTRTPAVPPSYTPGPSNTPTSSATVTATATATPCGATNLLFEGFEDGTLGGFEAVTTLGSSPWEVVTNTVATGDYSAHVSDPNEQSDQQLTQSTPVAIPASAASAVFQFKHTYSFENLTTPFDGGVLEYSTDGLLWVDAGPLITEGGYTGVIDSASGNPLAGRDAWVKMKADFPAFGTVTVDLMSLRGQSVQFRFREGSDLNTGAPGWWVDDIVIRTGGICTPGTVTTSTPGTVTTSTPGTATTTRTRTPVATTTATACPVQFTDVPANSTFYSQIRCLACKGIMGGYSDNTFRPNNNVTRGQLSKIVANSAGFNEPASGQTFEDVKPGSTFYEYIERMASRAIIGGYPCGGTGEPCGNGDKPYFRPNANATRGQISKIVSEAADINDPVSGQTYEDMPSTNTFYVWIERLTARGVMSGYPCGSPGEPCKSGNRSYFRPNNNATRGQTSKIVANTFFPNCQTLARR